MVDDKIKIPEEFIQASEMEYSYYLWGRSRLIRTLFHPLWWIFSKPYRFYRFTKLPPEERKKQAEKWAKNFRKSLKYPNIKIDDVVNREEIKSLVLDSILYHVLRDEETLKFHGKRMPPKVFLLKGGSGTGKTFLAKAIMNAAFEMGLKKGVFVKLDIIRASEVKSMWYGASGSNMADRLSQMMTGTSVILVDEAQQFVTKSMGAGSEEGPGQGHSADISVSTSFLNALDVLLEKPFRSIILLCTDKYESILTTIRRRSHPIDLDEGFTEDDMLELIKRECEKYEITDLDHHEILNVLGQTVRAIGEGKLTPDDIVKAFEKVIDKIETPRRKNIIRMFKEKIKIAEEEKTQPTIRDFVEVSKLLKEYRAQEMTEAAREAKQYIFPTERFTDVGGLHLIRNDIINEIKWSLDPELAKQVGYEPPRGFLFHGPPGTGKTLLAKAIAGEFKVPFYLVKGPSLLRKWVGESEKATREIFKDAKKNAPSIIFIDELDALGMRRGERRGDSGVSHNVLTTLLTELDGFNPLGKVVFIGCTNRKDLIDPALDSRLTRKFEFAFPETTEEKKDIIAVHLRHVKDILDEKVTADSLITPFMKYTFSPRIIADSIKQAARERGKEIMACVEILAAIDIDNPILIDKIKKRYRESFKNIHQAYRPPNKDWGDHIEMYRMVAKGRESAMDYPLRAFHIKNAINKILKDDAYEERLEMQRVYREKEPIIGKIYGLAVEGGELQRGTISPIEVKVYPARNKEDGGFIQVLGTVGESLKESAEVARTFLREYIPDIMEKDICIHIPSPGEGREKPNVAIAGPSAQMAMACAVFSALTKIKGNPNICMTGKVDIYGKAGLVGGIHPKRGSAKIDVAAEEGFNIVIIPKLGYDKLVKDFSEYMKVKKNAGLTIMGGDTFWDYAEIVFDKPKNELIEIIRKR